MVVFFSFFLNLYVWSDLLCEYAPEEPSTRLVDNDDLGGKCNTNHIKFVISGEEILYRRINAQ